MLQEYALVYYGPNDPVTGYYIKKLIDDLKDDNFIDLIIETVRKETKTLQDYEEILKIKVILEYELVMDNINSPEFLEVLSHLYKKLTDEDISRELIKKKTISYINQSAVEIFKQANYNIQKETLMIGLNFAGAMKVWDEIITHANELLLTRYFNELYEYTKKKKLNDLTYKMINKILFPISTKRYEEKIGIALRIRSDFKDVFNRFKIDLCGFFDLAEFANLTNVEQVKMLRDTLGSKILGIEGEIQLKSKLEDAEEIFDENLKESGMEYEITSKEFADLEELYDDFREKFYLLTYKENFPIYQIMQYQDKKPTTILDHVSNLDGIRHEKYGNVSFSMNFHYFETLMVLETIHLIYKYKDMFWEELSKLAIDIEGFIGLGGFLKADIKKLEKLVNEKDFFLASSFVTQLIERLLRELLLKLLYGVTDILKEAKFTLGIMLDIKRESILKEIFTSEEIETMEYFLINNEYGLNLRNRLAHYNINSEEVGIDIFARLLHILVFILVKLDYQGIKFESENLQFEENQ